ncbi:MAG: hypothetical protein JXM69_06570, partial [Anaerolineae bacterium]|nr:hypothetical protein [Anaerolineae bacterium]
MVKKLQRVSPQQSSEQLTSPVDLPKVREQVPNWLRMLLAKYGETEGRVVGLESESISQEGTVGPPPPTSEEESQVSSLLEQMATTGIDATPDTNVPTSVEWGAAPAESPPSIDDFLTGMETRQPDYTRQEYVQPAYEDTDYPETDESAFDEQTQADAIPPSGGKDVPDWLTEALEESPVVGSAEPSWAKTSVPSSAEDEAAPDWLTEALDMPPAELTPATPLEHAPQPPLAPVDHEVPDWLLETPSETGEPVSAESTSELSGWLDEVPETGSSQPGGEIPDWLTGEDLPGVAGPESPPVAAPEPDSFVSDIPDWQVPDWITEGVDALSAEDRSQETLAQGPVLPEPDIPDWIANGETPTTPAEPVVSPTFEPRQMPDWLAAVDEEAVPLEEAGPPPLPEAVNVPEWLVTGPEVSVTPAEVPPEQVPVVPQEKVEVPSWLQPLQAESSAASTIPPAGVPEWLDNIQVSTGASVAPPTQPPDWLQYIQADAVEAREKQKELSPPASKLKRLAPRPKSSPEPDVSSLPDWAAGLVPPAAPAGQVPSTLPDWAEALVPPEYPIDDAAKEVPEPAVEPAPQAELDMRFEVTELPEAAEASPLPTAATGEDWLADLRETIPTEPPSSPEPVEPAVETEVEIPAWLTGAEETAVEEVPKAGVEPAVEPELEIPDWLGETEP